MFEEMGVGFSTTIVTKLGVPSLPVLVSVSVTNGGALVIVDPAPFVVVTNTVDWNVVLHTTRSMRLHVESAT